MGTWEDVANRSVGGHSVVSSVWKTLGPGDGQQIRVTEPFLVLREQATTQAGISMFEAKKTQRIWAHGEVRIRPPEDSGPRATRTE